MGINQASSSTALLSLTQVDSDSSLFGLTTTMADLDHVFGTKVGLNTLSPAYELDIVGNMESVTLNLAGQLTVDQLNVSGNEDFYLSTAAFLGLGTTSPEAQLHMVKVFDSESDDSNYTRRSISFSITSDNYIEVI